MTLHDTIENTKKAGVGAVIGVLVIGFLVILFKVGVMVKNILYPPKIDPPTYAFGELPPLQFPTNAIDQTLKYKLNTEYDLPDMDFPDRLDVFQIAEPKPSLNNFKVVQKKVAALGFVGLDGAILQETELDTRTYRWDQSDEFTRTIIFDTVDFHFDLTTDYKSRLSVLEGLRTGQYLSTQESAIDTVRTQLNTIGLLHADIDLDKTKKIDPAKKYLTYPQLFRVNIAGHDLEPAASLDQAQVIRVDLYQKDISYQLNTGRPGEQGLFTLRDVTLPILYPKPPYSTMNFLIASGKSSAEIVEAHFFHQEIVPPDPEAIEPTYPIITAEEAFEELKNGNAYIASYYGSDQEVIINNVYLAYYLGDREFPQQYLMPIFVFEGKDGFFGYVSAVRPTVEDTPTPSN